MSAYNGHLLPIRALLIAYAPHRIQPAPLHRAVKQVCALNKGCGIFSSQDILTGEVEYVGAGSAGSIQGDTRPYKTKRVG